MGVNRFRVVRGSYSKSETPPMPYVLVRVYTPTKSRSIEVEAKIDTGFSGTLLLSIEDYLRLGLQLYERLEKALGVIAGGYHIELRVSRGIVELNGVLIPCNIYTTLFAKKSLLGRGILNRFRAHLDGLSKSVVLEIPP